MTRAGSHGKPYSVRDFRQIEGWEENLAVPSASLAEDEVLYLHASYVVTRGPSLDSGIIFDKVTDLWKEACRKTLHFTAPE